MVTHRFLLVGLLCLLATPSNSAVIVVEGDCTLSQAIRAANMDAPTFGCPAGSGPDTVVLTENVELTTVNNTDDGPNGLPRIMSSIVIEGGGFSITRAAGSPNFRILHVTYPDGDLELRDVTVSRGTEGSARGAGIRVEGESLIVANSTISNHAGDGIYVNGFEGKTQSFPTVDVTGSTISDNQGVGMFYNFGWGTITNTTVSGNSGAGILLTGSYNYNSRVDVVSSTLAANGGSAALDIQYGGYADVRNSVFGLNLAPNCVDGCGFTCGTDDEGGNLADDESCPWSGSLTGLSTELSDNGGPTLTHSLAAGSSAIDFAASCGLVADQRGFIRSDGLCDSGAFEFGVEGTFLLGVAGPCPGQVSIGYSGATPDSSVVIAWSDSEGSSTVPGGVCAGTALGLDSPRLLVVDTSTRTGTGVLEREVSEQLCDARVQAVDLAQCATSDVEPLGIVWKQQDLDTAYDNPQAVHSADVDGDGDQDVLAVSFDRDEVTWWENSAGDGSAWTATIVDGDFDGAWDITSADIDGDGDVDLLGAANSAGKISWWENLSGDASTWVEHNIDAAFAGPKSVVTQDLDGDGDMDVAAVSGGSDDVSWWENVAGDGLMWTEHTVDDDFDSPQDVSLGDLDGDGDQDVVAVNQPGFNANRVAWWQNIDGNGTEWVKTEIDSFFNGAVSVVVADIDGDGDQDVLASAFNAYDVTWWENDLGDGSSWTERTIDGEFVDPESVHAADVDGDGDLDVLAAGANGDTIAWWENVNGDGSLWSETAIDANFEDARAVYSADLDGDGDLDVLGAGRATDTVAWWANPMLP